MMEREKQRSDQQKKHAAEKERHEHPKKDAKVQAGMAIDPETMKDKGLPTFFTPVFPSKQESRKRLSGTLQQE